MAYIGRGTDNISNVEVLDNITFNGNSSYTLQKGGANFVPVSANNILLSINGVVQANNFSVSGSTIDFGTAVTGTCNFVLHFGTGLITTVQDGAVTTAKIGNDAVTYAKLQNLATANRVLGSTSTGLIGETQIATAMVSDDAITYAKMQDTSAANRVLGAASAGTVGEVQVATDMIADAQVDESKLKISNTPTNGYFLSAQSGNTGGLTWAEAGGGGMDLVSAVSITGDINAISTDAFSSSYNNYKVYVYGLKINGTANNLAMFRVRTSSGDYTSSNYIVAANGQYGNSGGTSFHNAGQWNVNALDLNGWHLPDDSNWSNAGTRDFIFHFYNTNSTTRYKNIWFDYGGPDETSNKMHTAHGRGHVETTSALTGFKLYSSAGTAFENEGKVLIYGLKES